MNERTMQRLVWPHALTLWAATAWVGAAGCVDGDADFIAAESAESAGAFAPLSAPAEAGAVASTSCASHGIPLLPGEKPIACRTSDDAQYPMTPLVELAMNPHKWKTYLKDQHGAIFVYNGPDVSAIGMDNYARPFAYAPPPYGPAYEVFAAATGPSATITDVNDWFDVQGVGPFAGIIYSLSWSLAGGEPGGNPAYMSNDGVIFFVEGPTSSTHTCQNYGGIEVVTDTELAVCQANYLPGVVALLVETEQCAPAYIASLYAKLAQINKQLDLLVQCEWSAYIQMRNLFDLYRNHQISYEDYTAQWTVLNEQFNQCRDNRPPLVAQQQALIADQFIAECGITPALP